MKKLTELPFRELQKVSNLIEFDGPILSHFQDNTGADILFYWVDYTAEYHRWLVFPVKRETLEQYQKGHISLRTVAEHSAANKFYLVDINDKVEYVAVCSLLFEEINTDYLPELNSFLPATLHP